MNKRAIMIVLSIITVGLVIGGGLFLYDKNKKSPEDNVPPVIKEMIRLNEDVKKTTIDIYNASGKLEGMSMVQSRVGDMQKTVELIVNMRHLVEENQKAIDRLIGFAQEHETFFYRKNLDWIFAIKDFYTDHNVTQHHISRANYLAAFETLVQYTFDNYANIMELQSSQHMKTYDVYYMRYRTAADSHNRFNRKRIAFQNEFMEKYPEVKPFLPGSHQLEPFKFWDKFSF
ncbi:MAG: hypothetical protein ABIJ31_10150 [Pseudomonadota bacterium]